MLSLKFNLQSKKKFCEFTLKLQCFFYRSIKENYLELVPLFGLDNLLLPIFIRNCSLEESKDLYEVVHPLFSISRISFMMCKYTRLDVKLVHFVDFEISQTYVCFNL